MPNKHFPAFDSVQPTSPVPQLTGLLRDLVETYGPPGSEERIRELIRDQVRGLADEVRTDALGNLVVRRRSNGASHSKVMVAAHMDEIGLMVTHIDAAGFCRFAALGDVQPLALLGQRCVFSDGSIGVIGREKKKSKPREIEPDRLFIDVVRPGNDKASIRVGDSAVLDGNFSQSGLRLVGKSLDDRIGCAILIETLRQLKKTPNELYFVFTVQQQVGARGAATSTFGIFPDFALVVDATETGDTPQAETISIALGKGPAIKIKDKGVLVGPAVKGLLMESAEAGKIAVQPEVIVGGSTDAEAIQITREGVQTGVISVPVRYLHTSSEVADLGDVENTIKLLLSVIAKPVKLDLE